MTYGLTVVFIALLIVVFFLILMVLLYGYKNYELVQNSSIWNKLIEEKITIAILEGSSKIKDDPELTALMENDNFKKLFLSVLITSKQRFSGDVLLILIEIFHEFGLDTLAWEKFRSNDELKKMRGLQALTAMEVEEALPEIIPLLNYHNPLIVSEAQYASAHFQGFKGLEFLTSLSSPLSKWQQLRLLYAIKDFSPTHNSFLETLLKHPNISIIEFALSLIRKFRVHTCHDYIIALLNHESIKVRIYAVKTLQAIENEDTIWLLTATYTNQEDEVKKAILLALTKSANKKSIDFLKTVLYEGNVTLQTLAAETLSALKETEYLRALLQKETVSQQIHSIVKQALAIKL